MIHDSTRIVDVTENNGRVFTNAYNSLTLNQNLNRNLQERLRISEEDRRVKTEELSGRNPLNILDLCILVFAYFCIILTAALQQRHEAALADVRRLTEDRVREFAWQKFELERHHNHEITYLQTQKCAVEVALQESEAERTRAMDRARVLELENSTLATLGLLGESSV